MAVWYPYAGWSTSISFLVIRVLFGVHDVLAVFLCTSSAFPLTNSILVSSVEAADGTSFHFKLIGGFWFVKRFVRLCPVISAIFSLPEEFMGSPCHANSFLVRFVSIILTWCISFRNLCRFPLKTCISLFMKEESWSSYLCAGVIAMIFVGLFQSANFLICLRPVLDSFLLCLWNPPPQMITNSLRWRWLISRRAKHVICSSLKPGVTAPITLKVVSSEDESSAAQPLAWL